jgi:epoxyqueuosine reductase
MPPLEERIKDQAHALGFELAGIAPAAPADGFDRLRAWLDRGFAGDMAYLERHADAHRHPASILPQVRSVVMVAMNYKPTERRAEGNAQGRAGGASPLSPGARPKGAGAPGSPASVGLVARYARGTDYHDVLRRKLKELLAWIQRHVPGCIGRGVVDTAPLLERDFARRAGLGWFGKNTMLLNKRLGSYCFLGALLLDVELRPDPPHQASHCGTCTACLDACPTGAFVAPGQMDARRCLSYLTIELRGPVPPELRPAMQDWLFGCDVCQEVCPWNRKAPSGTEPALQPRPDLEAIDLVELLGLSPEAFRRRFRGTAVTRAKRRGLLRNAALILGNRGDPAALPALRRALDDPEPLVREAAQRAIERIGARGRGSGAGRTHQSPPQLLGGP